MKIDNTVFKKKICVVGLGYVGLPLAVEFSKICQVTGFDKDTQKIEELKKGIDYTSTIKYGIFQNSNLEYYCEIPPHKKFDFYIVTVPTPVDLDNKPDLTNLIEACKSIATNMSENSIIVFESTVFPGTTEKVCAPIISEISGINEEDIRIAYSPERINPGDTENMMHNTSKLIAASNDEILEEVMNLYRCAITPKMIRCSSIMVAEASKVLENVQRDVNIALINEISPLLKSLDLDTRLVPKLYCKC